MPLEGLLCAPSKKRMTWFLLDRRYGFWRPVVERTVEKFLACGDLREGFARVRCPECRHEYFVAFSCRRWHAD
jgi:hypothetical protein